MRERVSKYKSFVVSSSSTRKVAKSKNENEKTKKRVSLLSTMRISTHLVTPACKTLCGTSRLIGTRRLAGVRSFSSVPSDEDMLASQRRFFAGNEKWRKEGVSSDELAAMSKGQAPELLWIGCSDSRAPASVCTGSKPGMVFTTRNIANTVTHTDMSLLSVVQYAVEVLKVKHVAVVGHSECGGIAAALANQPLGLIDNWLRHIQDTAELHHEELSQISDMKQRTEKLADLHVEAGVEAVGRIDSVRKAWASGQPLWIHGWKFHVGSGKLEDLKCSLKGPEDLHTVFNLPNMKN